MDQQAMDKFFQIPKYYYFYKERVTKIWLEVDESDYISSGCFGDVFFYNDGCIKIATCLIPYPTIAILDELRNIVHPNLYTIRHFYYNSTDESAFVKAYDMDYYLPDDIDILTMPIDYILDNFNDLCDLACKLASHSIMMSDTHEDNVILQENRMILIDADRWISFYSLDNDELKSDNYRAIVHLLCRLYYKALTKLGKVSESSYYPSNNDYNMVLRQLENISIEELLKEHQEFKYPIDYIEAKVKKLR